MGQKKSRPGNYGAGGGQNGSLFGVKLLFSQGFIRYKMSNCFGGEHNHKDIAKMSNCSWGDCYCVYSIHSLNSVYSVCSVCSVYSI